MTPANAPSRNPTPTPWGLVILLGSLTAMGPLAIDMYLPSLPAIRRALSCRVSPCTWLPRYSRLSC